MYDSGPLIYIWIFGYLLYYVTHINHYHRMFDWSFLKLLLKTFHYEKNCISISSTFLGYQIKKMWKIFEHFMLYKLFVHTYKKEYFPGIPNKRKYVEFFFSILCFINCLYIHIKRVISLDQRVNTEVFILHTLSMASLIGKTRYRIHFKIQGTHKIYIY